MATDRLNARQQAFVIEYLKDPKRNAKQAYINAGYAARGNAAEVSASQLLRRPQVAAEVERIESELLAVARSGLNLTFESLTLEVARGAFFDLRRLVNEDGTPKALHELDDDTASAIAGVEVEELFEGRGDERRHVGRIHKFKLVDRKAFIDMGLRVIGGYKEDNKQTNPGESLAEMLKGMKRSALPVVQQVEPDEGV